MPDATQDFWPTDLKAAATAPAAILRQQAALLGQKTHNLVEAQVETVSSPPYLIHNFVLVAPSLDNYRFNLFRIHHEIAPMYPVIASQKNTQRKLESEEELLEWLKQTLGSEETKRVINSLLSQVSA